MKEKPIYFDYNATTPLKPEVKTALENELEQWGNPSSIHFYGRESRKRIEHARQQIADLTDTKPANIIFTSGGTESNNTILRSFALDKKIAVLSTEHPSILNCLEEKTLLPVDQNGLINLDYLKKFLEENQKGSVFLSIQYVNSETGVIQPLRAISDLTKKYDALLHTDGVQAAGRLSVSFKNLGVDFMTLSSHKIGGPQGVGALIAADLKPFSPLLLGGGQERRRRAGTENTAGIVGFGIAATLAKNEMETYRSKMLALRKQLEQSLIHHMDHVVIFGERSLRACNTTCFAIPNHSAEKLLMYFDLEGICLSSGSACSSGSIQPSHVLKAMQYDDEITRGALRISIGWQTTAEEINYFLEKLLKKIKL